MYPYIFLIKVIHHKLNATRTCLKHQKYTFSLEWAFKNLFFSFIYQVFILFFAQKKKRVLAEKMFWVH